MSGRLVSLDAFRGLTVAAMVLVNNPGTWLAIYSPLRHAEWHGWTPTDLVFPFFLVIVGVAIPFAVGTRLERGERPAIVAARIARRSAVIFALGLLLHAVPRFEMSTLRIPGVLQRIAVCYLVAALLYLVTSWRSQAGLAALLLSGYWAAMTLVPVPGFGAGDLGKEGNLAAYVDRAVLGAHIWRPGRVYDPEGILSTVPAIATTLVGMLTGRWLRSARTPRATVLGLWLGGVGIAASGQVWSIWFPINKGLWTSSYALLAAGLALIVLGTCYWLIEVRGYRRWAQPFVVFGVNALALFFLSTLLARVLILVQVPRADGRRVALQALIFERLFASWADPVHASLAYALVYLLAWLAVMWALHRRNIHLTV